MKTSFNPLTRDGLATYATCGLLLAVIAFATHGNHPSAEAVRAHDERQAAAERLEQLTVDECNTAIRRKLPTAKAGFTRDLQWRSDGALVVRIPVSWGRVERMARCVGYEDGTVTFGVERELL